MIRPIVLYPDPVLQQPTQAVGLYDTQLLCLVEDLFDSMYEAKGIGLAAPQIGISKRVTVIDVTSGARSEDKLVFVNPEILFFEGQHIETEGCLSLPGIGEEVGRAAKVKVRAQNIKGEWFGLEAEGLLARALQHEIDHLDGILFFSRVNEMKRSAILRQITRLRNAGKWRDDFVAR